MKNYDQVNIRINQWRISIIRKLILFLAVFNSIATILQYVSLTYTPSIIEHIIVWGLTLILFIIAIVKYIPPKIKAVIVMVLIYASVIKQFLIHGMISSSPVYLVAAPVIAFFSIGKKAGWFSFFISSVVIICFTVLAYVNILPRISYVPVDSMSYRVWIEIGLSIIVVMVVLLFIIINYHAFVTGAVQEALDQSAENALLEKEVHHRVKNNLALMKSLIAMQSEKSENIAFKQMSIKLQGRIHSLALVHEKLYGVKEKRNIDIESYIQSMVTNLLELHQKLSQIEIIYDIEPLKLHIDQATPLGMVINEIVSNSLQHAFIEKNGSIWISLHVNADETIEIIIEDSGPGFNSENISKDETLGIHFIEILAMQFNGTIDYYGENSAKYIIRFNKRPFM